MKLEVKKEAVEAKVKEKLAELDNNGKYEMSQNSEEYEKIIQKLEAEVRNHISVRLLLHFH
jgi:ABC-type Zn2+ transport system substrate-binding protein/surface adhesin